MGSSPIASSISNPCPCFGGTAHTLAAMSDGDVGTIVKRVGIFSWSMIGVLILVIAGFWVLIEGRVIFAPLFLASVVVVILNPTVSWFERRGIPRLLGTLAGFVVFVAAVALLAIVTLPSILDQAESLVDQFPDLYNNGASDIRSLLDSVGLDNVVVWNYDQIVDYLNDPGNRDAIFGIVFDRLGWVTAGIFEVILVFLVGPVVAFYFLIDLPNVKNRILGMVPERRRAEVAYLGRQLNAALGGFLRGQMLVALIVGVMLSLGYRIIGLQFWLIIGLIGGLLNIVPFIGPWVGGALGVIVALATADPKTALLAILVAFIVQQIDNNFVSPTVLRATVRLHPAVTLLVLILAGAVAGVWGVIIAVPLTAAIKIVVGHWWRTRVLEQTWEQATEAMFQEPEPSRLRRTGEMPVVVIEDQPEDPD